MRSRSRSSPEARMTEFQDKLTALSMPGGNDVRQFEAHTAAQGHSLGLSGRVCLCCGQHSIAAIETTAILAIGASADTLFPAQAGKGPSRTARKLAIASMDSSRTM